MGDIYGRVAGAIHLRCSDEHRLRSMCDLLVDNGTAFEVDPTALLVTINLGDPTRLPEGEGTDLDAVMARIELLLQPGNSVIPFPS